MSQLIIYKQQNDSVGVIYPALACGLPIYEIARKDVPKDMPFFIVDADVVPTDHTFFDAFEVDFTNPHGFGVGSQTWFIEKYQAELATLNPQTNQERIAWLNTVIAVQQAELTV